MAEVNARKRGNKWQYYFEGVKVDGKRNRIVKSGFNTKKEALTAGAEALAIYNNGGIPVLNDSISVATFTEQYLEYYKNKNKYITYCTNRDQLKAHFIKDYGGYRITSINCRVAEEFIFSLKDKGLATSTIAKHISRCKNLFDYAIRMKVVRENPFENLTPPTDTLTPKKRTYYTDEFINQLLDVYKGDMLEPVIMLGYHAGLRLSESLALTWDDIDFENKTITINKQLLYRNRSHYFTGTKYSSNRIISIDAKLTEYLKTLKEKHGKYPFKYDLTENKELTYGTGFSFVVVQKDGKLTTSSTIHGHICYLKTTYGFPDFKPHELRHTHCTKLLSNGVDVKYVQKRLGHKSIQTTLDIYHHLTKDIALSEDSKLDNLF